LNPLNQSPPHRPLVKSPEDEPGLRFHQHGHQMRNTGEQTMLDKTH